MEVLDKSFLPELLELKIHQEIPLCRDNMENVDVYKMNYIFCTVY